MSDWLERLDRGEVIERVRRHLRRCCVDADAEAVVAVVLLELGRQGMELGMRRILADKFQFPVVQ